MAFAMTSSMPTAQLSASTSTFRGASLRASVPRASAPKAAGMQIVCETERIRLFNLKPLEGSRRKEQRKGRGRAAGQGLTCGYGNRGQKARSGKNTRPGFEGGQNPTYRAVPKMKGIAGGMSSGQPKYITVNLSDISAMGSLEANAEISLETLQTCGLLNVPKKSKLPLKVLGNGEITAALSFKAGAFSASALAKIEAAGGSVELIAPKEKWTREAHNARVAALA